MVAMQTSEVGELLVPINVRPWNICKVIYMQEICTSVYDGAVYNV
jgi:hypothetical protein